MPKQQPLPPSLPALVASLSHPDVTRFELATTAEGGWAVRAYAKRSNSRLVETLQDEVGQYPVIVVQQPAPMQVARPAYPSLRE